MLYECRECSNSLRQNVLVLLILNIFYCSLLSLKLVQTSSPLSTLLTYAHKHQPLHSASKTPKYLICLKWFFQLLSLHSGFSLIWQGRHSPSWAGPWPLCTHPSPRPHSSTILTLRSLNLLYSLFAHWNLCVSCSLYPHAHLTVIHPSTVVTSFWNLLRSPLRSNQDWHLTSVFSLPPVHASNMASHWIKPLVFFYLLFLLSKHKTCPITSIWCTFDG